jgi:uncharacterized protein YjlB
MTNPRRIFLEPDDWIPNSSRFPVLIYRNVVDYKLPEVGAALMQIFERNGWRCGPGGNILREYHYHSAAHEVIGIASGAAILGIGGPHSIRVAVDATDVLVLPAGTGHCRLADNANFSVVVANPPSQKPDTCRTMASFGMVETIDALSYPDRDPVFGADFNIS